MNASQTPSDEAQVPGQGLFISGEFFARKAGRPYTKRDNSVVEPVTVSVAVGDSLLRVEYESEDAAIRATKDASKGDQVVLPVFANGPWDNERGRSGRVSYRGR